MTKNAVSIFLIIYIAYLLVAVIFRLDYFPMTWAPMYSAVKSTDDYKITVLDKKQLKEKGFVVKHRDGSASTVVSEDLNIPFRNFYPLYSQRIYSIGPPKHRRAIDQYGKVNAVDIDWETRLFNSLNQTFGYNENDPKFIVEISASKTILFYKNSKTDLTLDRSIHDTITIAWKQPGKALKDKPYLIGLDE